MAGSDIKAVTRTATGAFFGGSARIRGIYIKTNASGSPAFKKSVVLAKKGTEIKLVRFGDPNMTIKKDQPGRRKSFHARHKCATAKDKFSARYWSCKAW